MKKIFFISICFFFATIACQKEDTLTHSGLELKNNTNEINELINVFDLTLKEVLNNQIDSAEKSASERNIENTFVKYANKTAILDNSHSENENNQVFQSEEYKKFVLNIEDATSFVSKEEYKKYLVTLKRKVVSSNLFVYEQQQLNDKLQFSIAFIDWMEAVNEKHSLKKTALNNSSKGDRCDNPNIPCSGNNPPAILEEGAGGGGSDWWDDWGKCTAAVLGSASGGALAGAYLPAAGCTVVLPVIGTIACGTVGAVVGAISGGLTALGTADAC